MENKLKHLELIQGVINRMAGNLFFLKGWSITLVAALFALFVKDANSNFIFIVYVPVIMFWILDGYYLFQERLFRSLYNDVRKLDNEAIDFSMDTSKYKKVMRNTWFGSMFSKTILVFYMPLIFTLILVTYLIL